ncbi:MAG: hypothetical protein AAGM21_00290 [Pseudomonadota bacterium]
MLRLLLGAVAALWIMASGAIAQEIAVNSGESSRQNMLACPEGSLATGVNTEGTRLLCQIGFDGFIVAEQVDENPATQWPSNQRVPLVRAAVAGSHNYVGPTMHACPRNQVVVGVHKGRNAFICATLSVNRSTPVEESVEPFRLGRYEVVSGQTRNAAMGCPVGMALAGIHFGNETLLCVETRICTDNTHCPSSNSCSSNIDPDRDFAQICGPAGVVRLNKSDNCSGDLVRFLGTAANTFNWVSDLKGDGDDARSALLLGVPPGALLEFYDNDRFQLNDDRAFFRVLARANSTCIGNLDLPPNQTFATAAVTGLKPTSGNLAGKVSSVRFFSEIRDVFGRCLLRAGEGPNSVNASSEFVELGLCDPVPGEFDSNGNLFRTGGQAPARWIRRSNGMIVDLSGGSPGQCLTGLTTRPSEEFRDIPEGQFVGYRLCDDTDAARWTYTAQGQMKIYSNMCLTTIDPLVTPGQRQTPSVEPCILPVPDRQRWVANL